MFSRCVDVEEQKFTNLFLLKKKETSFNVKNSLKLVVCVHLVVAVFGTWASEARNKLRR